MCSSGQSPLPGNRQHQALPQKVEVHPSNHACGLSHGLAARTLPFRLTINNVSMGEKKFSKFERPSEVDRGPHLRPGSRHHRGSLALPLLPCFRAHSPGRRQRGRHLPAPTQAPGVGPHREHRELEIHPSMLEQVNDNREKTSLMPSSRSASLPGQLARSSAISSLKPIAAPRRQPALEQFHDYCGAVVGRSILAASSFQAGCYSTAILKVL